ncbi:MAG: hypothetical protein WBX06_00755 [Acidobacteriaceae bacterium]|jgi:hypothetical protein
MFILVNVSDMAVTVPVRPDTVAEEPTACHVLALTVMLPPVIDVTCACAANPGASPAAMRMKTAPRDLRRTSIAAEKIPRANRDLDIALCSFNRWRWKKGGNCGTFQQNPQRTQCMEGET